MKSSITFLADSFMNNLSAIVYMKNFFIQVAELADLTQNRTTVDMQHSLKHDRFCVMVECGTKTFATKRKMALDAFIALEKVIRKHNDGYKKAKERPARKTSSRRPGRKGTARVRGSRVLQKRRAKAGRRTG